jgi:hypothetical protein
MCFAQLSCCALLLCVCAELERKKHSDSDADAELTKEHLQPPQPSFTPQVCRPDTAWLAAVQGGHTAAGKSMQSCRAATDIAT